MREPRHPLRSVNPTGVGRRFRRQGALEEKVKATWDETHNRASRTGYALQAKQFADNACMREHGVTPSELSRFDKMVGRGMYAAAIGAGLSPDEARVREIQAKRRIRYRADQ